MIGYFFGYVFLADIIVLNNVFEFFQTVDEQMR